MHHQAIKELGDRLQATAISEDGLIEGLEMINHPFAIGCQWHPEELTADPHQKQLFIDFIEVSLTRKIRKGAFYVGAQSFFSNVSTDAMEAQVS